MFINVFDVERRCTYFDVRVQDHYKIHMRSAVFDRLMAYEAYRVAVRNMLWFDRIMEYANFTLQYLRHDERWNRFVKSDKLQQKTQSLLKVTPTMREFHKLRMLQYRTNYFLE